MKKYMILAIMGMMAVFTANAQNYMVVNTETVFKSINSYNAAVTQIEKLAEQYQKTVDDAYAEVERMYEAYIQVREGLSPAARQSREDDIINREKEINRYQQQIFGQEGELNEKRIELIKPIQDRVFAVINKYAEDNGFSLVIDIASNPTILYYTPSVDRTTQIVNLTKSL